MKKLIVIATIVSVVVLGGLFIRGLALNAARIGVARALTADPFEGKATPAAVLPTGKEGASMADHPRRIVLVGASIGRKWNLPELPERVGIPGLTLEYERLPAFDKTPAVEGLLEDYRAHWLVPHLQGVNARALGRIREADSFENEAMLYKRLNPADWLQSYDILLPEPIPEETGSGEKKSPSKKSPPYLLLVAVPALFLVLLTLRRIRK